MTHYRFKVMPFGLNIAPRIFTKLVTVVVKHLRERNICVAAYLDDWLVWAPSEQQYTSDCQLVMQELEKRVFPDKQEEIDLRASQEVYLVRSPMSYRNWRKVFSW